MKRLLRSATLAAAAAALALGAASARAQSTTTTVNPDGTVETKTSPSSHGRSAARDLRLRAGRLRLRLQAGRPRLVRRDAADEAARPSTNQFGEDGRTWASVRQSRLGVKGWFPTAMRRDQDDLRVRALRHGRRRRADDVPAPPRLGRGRALRRGPDVEPVHGPGRLPELPRVLGAAGHGVLPERPDALDADAGRQRALHRARAARGERRRRQLRATASSSRASRSGRSTRTSRPTTRRRASGATSSSPASSASSSGTTRTPTRSTSPATRPGWGLNLCTNLKLGDSSVIRASALYGEGVENYMNDAPIDIGIQNNFSDPAQADRRQAAARAGPRRVPRPQLEQAVLDGDRLVVHQHRQHGRPDGRATSRTATTRSRTSSTTRSRAS